MKKIDLRRFPTSAGVYLMKGSDGQILYVGKAKNLRNRLRSYFSGTGDGRAHIQFLLKRLETVETIVTDTEKEALILENTLIKKHHPRYNLSLRDDKTYVSVRLDLREEFPSLQVVRKVKQDGALYFGPYSSAAAVRATLKQIYRMFPLRHYPLATCRRRGRPCLFFQIGQCSGPCHGKITPEAYGRLVQGVIALLSGRENEVLGDLRRQMNVAAATFRYEEAAHLRDQLRAIEATVERQKVVEAGGGDQDVLGLHREGGEVEIALLFIRRGKLTARRTFSIEWRMDEEELLCGFLQQYYGKEVLIPERVLVPFLPESAPLLEEWLGERKGSRVRLQRPVRGERARLVELAARNAAEAFRERGSRQEARELVLNEVKERLQLDRLPRRMECFDISNIQGAQSVGSMAVMIDGEPARQDYRSYNIRTVAGADDYASLAEVLGRRLRRAVEEGNLPDLILIDGGKGQLGVLTAVLEETGLAGRIEAAAIAKSRVLANVRGKAVEKTEERFFRPGRKNPMILRGGSAALFLLERLRNEAHRFAITHHRKRRGKKVLASALEEIPGVGPTRRRVLLKHFGSLKKIKEASFEELRAAPGIPEAVARGVYESFRQGE